MGRRACTRGSHASRVCHGLQVLAHFNRHRSDPCLTLIDSFIRSPSPLVGQYAAILPTLHDLHASAREWALAAGKQALQDIDCPTLASIQTCQILATYWCAADEPQRNIMFSSEQ